MTIAFTDEWLASIGADRDGRREFSRDPVARGGVEAGGYALEETGAERPAEPKRGRARTADTGSLADGGNVSRPAQSRQAGGSPAPRNKFGAVRTVAPASWGGTRLADSKAGATLARTLDTRKQVGSILDWAEEVSIPVGVDEDGKVIRYRADALVLLGYVDAPDGGEPALVVRLVDAKRGKMDTPTSKAKRAAIWRRAARA